MKSILRAGLLALLLALPAVPAVLAAPLRFVSIETAPWASRSADGTLSGFFPDVVRELERRRGRAATLSLQPFVRIGQELESGAQDCTILAAKPEWQTFARLGEVIYRHEIGVVARRDVSLRTPGDLRGKRFSVLRGLALGPAFDADPQVGREEDTDYQIGLRKLTHRRVDGVAGAIQTIEFLARQAGLEAQLGDRLTLGNLPLALQCSRKTVDAKEMSRLNTLLRNMLDDGTVSRLLDRNNYH